MRILRRPGQTCEVLARHQLLKFEAEILPCGVEPLAGAAKQLVGKIGRPEPGESRQPFLLVRSGGTALRFD
jgi:hypothetical protein